jgi:hypothetical protein
MSLATLRFMISVTHAEANRSEKPNIILFFVDDNVVDTINAGGLCPNIDSLAKRGITFTLAYTPHGVCGPARFAVLSGRYMSRCIEQHCLIPESRIHGSTSMGGLTIEGQRFIWSGSIMAEALSKGNITNHGRTVDGVLAAQHHPEWRAKATIEFIERRKEEPFFCYIAENLMHSPPLVDDMRKDPRVAFDGIIFDKPLDVMGYPGVPPMDAKLYPGTKTLNTTAPDGSVVEKTPPGTNYHVMVLSRYPTAPTSGIMFDRYMSEKAGKWALWEKVQTRVRKEVEKAAQAKRQP